MNFGGLGSRFGSLGRIIASALAGVPAFTLPPTISGAAGGTLTVTPGHTVNSTGVPSFQWLCDNLPIPGATGLTLDGSANPGTISVVESIAADGIYAISQAFANGTAVSLAGFETFNETSTNNQKYNTVGGRTLTMAGGIQSDQDNYIVKTIGSTKVLSVSTNGVDQTVGGKFTRALAFLDVDIGTEQRIEVDLSASATGFTLPPNIVLWYTDEFNYIYLTRTSGKWTVFKVINGAAPVSVTNLQYGTAGGAASFVSRYTSYTSSYTLRVDIAQGILRMYDRVDAEVQFTQMSVFRVSTLIGTTADLNTYAADAAKGHRAGIVVTGTTTGVDNVRVYSLAAPIAISTVDVDTSNNVLSLTIAAAFTGATAPTGFDVAVMRADGATLVPRRAVSSPTIGAGTATLTVADAALRAGEGSTCYVQIWKTGPGLPGTDGVALGKAIPVYQTVFPYRQGINEGFTTTQACDAFRDLFQQCRMYSDVNQIDKSRDPDVSSIALNPYGLPTAVDPTYPNGFTFFQKRADKTVPERGGSYIISYPTDKTLHCSNSSNFTVLSPGVARYTRVPGPSDTGQAIWFTGASVAFSPTDRVTILQEGDPHPERLISDITAQNYASLGKTLRVMSARQINKGDYKTITPTSVTLFSAADRKMGPTSQVPYSIEQQVSACNQANIDLYWNASFAEDESYWRADARYAAQNLAPGLKAEVEWANEVWNSDEAVWGYAMQEGVRMGYAPDSAVSYATRVDPGTVYSNGNGNIKAGNNLTKVAVPAGGLLYVRVEQIGAVVLRAGADYPIGTALPIDAQTTTSAPFWTVVYTPAQVSKAADLYQAHMSDRLFTIWEEEFAAVGRPAPDRILGAQTDDSVSPGLKRQLDWVNPNGIPFCKRLNRLAIAPYWKQVNGHGNIGDYSVNYTTPTFKHSWTSVEKGWILNSDQTAFFNAFWAIADDCIDDAIARAKSLKHDLAAQLVARGVSPDAVQLMSYECGWHVQFWHWPAGDLATAAAAAFTTIIQSPEYAARMKRYLKGLAENIGGTHVLFDRCGGIPTTGADGAGGNDLMQSWSIMPAENDNILTGVGANLRFAAAASARNGVFT